MIDGIIGREAKEGGTEGESGVVIKGATGVFAENINGVYSPCGPSSYRKIGGDEQLLEYRSREWQVVGKYRSITSAIRCSHHDPFVLVGTIVEGCIVAGVLLQPNEIAPYPHFRLAGTLHIRYLVATNHVNLTCTSAAIL